MHNFMGDFNSRNNLRKKMRLRPGKFRPRKYMAKFDFMFI